MPLRASRGAPERSGAARGVRPLLNLKDISRRQAASFGLSCRAYGKLSASVTASATVATGLAFTLPVVFVIAQTVRPFGPTCFTSSFHFSFEMNRTSTLRCVADNNHQDILGRPRGGLTSKIHAVVDTNGLPVHLALMPGEAHDS